MRAHLSLTALSLGLCLVSTAACAPPSDQTGARFTETGQLIAMSGGDGGAANACFTCHGLEGQGDGQGAPRLAGLDAGYLQKQLEDYATGRRADAVMSPVAGWLNADDRRAVAAWYAAMTPAGEAVAGPDVAPAVFLRGDPARDLTACAACHGPQGEGRGPGNPAIAGQPAAYTAEQLMRWRRAERRNDPRHVMRQVAAALTDAEIQAIAEWLSRAPISQAPANDAASVSAAATASARSAPLHEAHRRDR